jgi:hypothetical protein
MKTPEVIFLVISIILMAVPAHGGGFAVKRTAGGYEIEMAMNRNPSVSDKNDLRITIKDQTGKYISNAPVLVNYYMPPMPSMAPMNYKVKAEARGTSYQVNMNLIMAGPWIIVVYANVNGKQLKTAVPIDAR